MLTLHQKYARERALLLYLLIIFSAAVIRDFVLTPYVVPHLITPLGTFVEPIWKLLLWILPTFLYIRFVLHKDPLSYLRLTRQLGQGIIWGLLAGCVIFVVFFLPRLLLHGISLHQHLGLDDWLNGVVLVGILEEIPFRGLLLQQFMEGMNFWSACTLTSLLFVGIHIPLWMSMSLHPFPDMLLNALFLFGLSYVFCYIFRRSGSLWSSIIAHSAYDLFATVFL